MAKSDLSKQFFLPQFKELLKMTEFVKNLSFELKIALLALE